MVAGDFSKSDMADAMNKPSVTGDAINEYIKHGYGKQAVVFCVNVAHSESVAESFNQAGINAYSIDGKTDAFTRDKVIEEFKNGDIKVLTNCQIVTEGFDLPSLEVLIQLRPTASLGLYMQMVGRVLRVAEGKKKAIILDHADNFKRHGFPCDKREWSLEKKIKAQKKKTFSTKMCTECFAVNSSTARVCFNCKSVFNVKEREGPEFIEGELSKVDKERFKKEKKKEQSNAQTYEELVELGRARGYKPGWARFIYESRKKKRNK
jgi:superfamily II DNA or RNA helicase